MLYYYTEFEDKLKDYKQIELLTLRLFENIQQHIKTLEIFKHTGYKDIHALDEREDVLANMLWIQSITLRNLSSSGEYIFHFFNELLELSYDPKVLHNLASLATNIFTRLESNAQISNKLAEPMLFYKPFAELSSHFQGDHQLLANTIKEALQDQSKLEKVPKSLGNLLLIIFDDNSTIIQIVKEHIEKGMKNSTQFTS